MTISWGWFSVALNKYLLIYCNKKWAPYNSTCISILCKIVPQRLGGVTLIPYRLGWPPLMRKALDFTNSVWNHFSTHLSCTVSLQDTGCEEEYTPTLVLALWTWLVQNNNRSCGEAWFVHATYACYGELLIGWNRTAMAWLVSDY